MKPATIAFVLSLILHAAKAQETIRRNLGGIVSAANKASIDLAIEKIYVHTDKSAYNTGDTLWFKAYVFDACYLSASSKSGLMYVEIATDSNQLIRRMMLPVYLGMAVGQIPLVPGDMPQGNYVLTAYTNWMRNFREEYIFRKPFYISAISNKDWLVNYSAAAANDGINLKLKLKRFDNSLVSSKNLSISIADKKRTFFRERLQTGIDGSLNLRFNLPQQAKSSAISLSLQDLSKEKETGRLIIPVLLNRPEHIDLQFMPEGGSLVAGLPARIAFKALNEDGYSTEVSGTILDSRGNQVTTFRSGGRGTGVISLLPAAGERYTAKPDLPGASKTYALPLVATAGITLHVNNPLESDSCEVVVTCSADVTALNRGYYLIASARGLICYAAVIRPVKGVARFMINKKTFPSGITRFTVNALNHQVLNERLAYIDHHDQLRIKVAPQKNVYTQRDSVELNIEVMDHEGNPVQGGFSLAVTDDGQVKTDTLKASSILSQLLLTSDLKGNIEDPGYYFQQPGTTEKWQQLDQLLLTQGWTGYDMGEMLKPASVYKYAPEAAFTVRGKVTNAFNKPVPASPVTLMGNNPPVVLDTLTDNTGTFSFAGLTPGEDAAFFVQSRNRKNKSFNVGIEMEEFQAPVFEPLTTRVIPWYVNIDTSRLQEVSQQLALQKEKEKVTGVKMLQEVVVTSRRVITDSKNLNGPGEADILITEDQLKKAGRTSLGDLMMRNVSGFGLKTDKNGNQFYAVNMMIAHLIIDGVNTEFFLPEGSRLVDHLKFFFDYYDAEEIKGIEVMKSGKYQMRYTSRYLGPMQTPWDHAFIEVTTRGGRGPFVKKAVGTYVYRPMTLVSPLSFYTPKYTPASKPDMSDLRSTIFWNPFIITDKKGKASLVFYTADNPGSYSIVIEGSDMEGNIGRGTGSIRVEGAVDR